MPLDLPQAIADYFAGDTTDAQAVSRCFAEDAVVIDEKQAHRGRPAIAAWKADTNAHYRYTNTPMALENDGEAMVVTAHLVGDFPGSPIDLRYRFTLSGAFIACLEIGA